MPAGEQPFPERFGPFILVRQLGVGGMGAAYLAIHGESGAMLVVKRMHPEFLKDESIFKRFVHEAEVASHVRHPNVAALVAMGTIDTEPFLATEYVFGIPISQIVDRIETSQIDPVPIPIGLRLALDLASGIESIHSARHRETGEPLSLIHRDIGARNVLVGFDGMIRIIDLGLGKSILSDWHTASQVLAGSPDYMPPEQAMGARVDGRADVYSTSVTIWELFAGRKRIREEGVAARLTRAIQAQPEPLLVHRRDAPKRLEAILKQGMQPDPELRTATAAIFRKALTEELKNCGKKVATEDVVEWLDAACATVIAKEKRALHDAREMVRALTGGTNAKTTILVGRPDASFDGPSPYEFYDGVNFVKQVEEPVIEERSGRVEVADDDDDLWEKITLQVRAHVNRFASSPSVGALAALVDPAAFAQRSMRMRVILFLTAMAFLCAIATTTAILLTPGPLEIQIFPIPEEAPKPPPIAARKLPAKAPAVAATGLPQDAEASPSAHTVPGEAAQDGETASADGSSTETKPSAIPDEPRGLTPEAAAKKADLVRRIRQLRRMRFDVKFQRKVTDVSTRLSRARSMKALDEIERALVGLEAER